MWAGNPFKRRIALGQDYRDIFLSAAGERVLKDLLRAAGMLETSISPTAEHTAFKEGRRSIGLHILEQLRWSEPELVKLAQERTTERLEAAEEG